MYHFTLVTALVWIAYSSTSVLAQGLYKWTDSRGVIHYTNTPTNSTAKTVDDALPPAANFQRPTPPVEPAQEAAKPSTGDSATPANAPGSHPGTRGNHPGTRRRRASNGWISTRTSIINDRRIRDHPVYGPSKEIKQRSLLDFPLMCFPSLRRERFPSAPEKSTLPPHHTLEGNL